MNATTSPCRKVHDLWRAADAGLALDASAQSLIDEHLLSCERCRFERQVLVDAAFDGTAAPAPILDELSHRRFVDTVLAAANGATRPQSEKSLLRPALVAGIAALIVAVAAFLAVRRPGSETQVTSVPTPAVRYLAIAGDITSTTGRLALDGTVDLPGRLCVSQGLAALSLGCSARLALLDDSCVSVRTQPSGGTAIALEKGGVVVDIAPGSLKSAPMVVETAAGSVYVTGTAFAAAQTEEKTWIHVYRGSVELEPKGEGGKRKAVRAGQASDFETVQVVPSSADQDEKNRESLRILAALPTAEDAPMLSIESLPAGATVELDGLRMGPTPLLARVAEGRMELTVSQGEAPVIREVVEVKAREIVRRMYDLHLPPSPREKDVEEVSSPESEDMRSNARGKDYPSDRPTRALAPVNASSAADLLKEAQILRAGKQSASAAKKYEELLRAYPSSSEALAGSLSLAELYLERLGRPADALRLFDQFLARAGRHSLRPEAELGRASALRALGRSSEEKAALEAFLEAYPHTLQAESVQKRLDDISNQYQ